MLLLVVAALAVTAAVVAVPLLKPDRRLREIDRFWNARRLTTSWAGLGKETPPGEG